MKDYTGSLEFFRGVLRIKKYLSCIFERVEVASDIALIKTSKNLLGGT